MREYDGDCYSEQQWSFLVRKATNSKTGQKFLKQLEQVLLSMPDKRLGEGSIVEYERRFIYNKDTGYYSWDTPIIMPTGLTCVLGEAYVAKLENETEMPRSTLLLAVAAELDDGDFLGYRDDGWGGALGSAQFGKNELGCPRNLAWRLAEENDKMGRFEKPEDRWKRMLGYVQSLIIKEEVNG